MKNTDDSSKRKTKTKTAGNKKTQERTKPSPRTVVIDKKVHKDLEKLPEWARDVFLGDLELISIGERPFSDEEPLFSAGDGVMELKVQGRPAYRCMYHLNSPGKVMVLHATAKTTQGQDKKLVATTKARLKSLK
ncbi:type II toxin-antitoxin system RelE/ParE family toxin [Stenotrophomonas maltophilia]|uniref:type II toxin-antitoxin system RelE/ParE family toxin n=1 Tax=Stenotrophomonas maltophilia TaxID=40324 RepID=UPI002ACCE11E|nr:type II toxin-antitoxin system RelE/ParE family toxin [Stenotrophomonas maltophilia]MDZ5781604.1 type II toxin-antitoxin system RelE/ParE family toxin [Stenotrophomonas maltophilia]